MAPVVAKPLSRLSRDSLVNLCIRWAQSPNAVPYLSSNRNQIESDEEDYLYEPAENVAVLKKLYQDLEVSENERNGLSKREIVDRIVDGDWRRGLSLQQLADLDLAYLEQNDTALRWNALKLVPYKLTEENAESQHPAKRRKTTNTDFGRKHYPTISPANFVANLKSHVSPLVKAHYTLHRLSSPSKLVVLRLYIVPNTPFAPLSSNVPRNMKQATDSGRVMYIALPDSCPYIYVSLSGNTGPNLASKAKEGSAATRTKIDIAATKRVILESIPKALSKPQERWSLETTKLTCRSLKSIGLLKGNGRPGTAGGAYSKFSEEYEWKPMSQAKPPSEKPENESQKFEATPLNISQTESQSRSDEFESLSESSTQILARFGPMKSSCHAKLDRVHITLQNLLSTPATSKSPTRNQPARKAKRKRPSLEDIEAGRDIPSNVDAAASGKAESAQITLCFSGLDVFRGLKELAMIPGVGEDYVDLERLPSWMTGDRGASVFVI